MKLNFELKPGPPLKPSKLDAFERKVGYSFPKTYREFLLTCNGGDPERTRISGPHENLAGIRLFLELTKSTNQGLLYYYNLMRDRIPTGFLPIALDECGNVFIINLNPQAPDQGVVYFWDHELEADEDAGEIPSYNNLTRIADTFQDLLNHMHPDPIIFDEE